MAFQAKIWCIILRWLNAGLFQGNQNFCFFVFVIMSNDYQKSNRVATIISLRNYGRLKIMLTDLIPAIINQQNITIPF
jgi:hypothetical protein